MLSTQNAWLRELCQGISDVDYVVGKDIARCNLVSDQQYIDLEMLFSFNNAEKSKGRNPYVQILTDDSGADYALLSDECIQYALSKRLSLLPGIEKHLVRDASDPSLSKTESGLAQKVLEEKTMEEKTRLCTTFLVLHYDNISPSQKLIGDELCFCWKKSDERYFLTSIDILGGYLN